MSCLRIPNGLQDVTPCWLTRALNGSGVPAGASVTGFSAEAIAEGKGFMSQIYRLRLEYDPDQADLPRTMMLKLPSSDPLLKTVIDGLGQNRREVRFYRELATTIWLRTPRSYYCDIDPANGNTVLLLEDMSYARQGDSVAGCSLAEARQSLDQLARFQAAWWNSPVLDRYDWIPSKDAEAGTYQEIYASAWESLLRKADDAMPPGLRLLGDCLAPGVYRIKVKLSRPPRTFVHGDYRLDNRFFLSDRNGQSVAAIDWGFCAQGRGAYEVATFVSQAFPPQQRRKEELGLLRGYHSILEENGVSGYPFEQCLYDYRLSMLEILVFWIITGGYCDYEGQRAQWYLRNTLERLDAAISDLTSTELVGLK